jgi:UDP-glucose 4-epimerase
VNPPAVVSGSRTILLTGGTGFIGSHIAVEVAAAGMRPVLYDDLCNSKRSVVERLGSIIGRPVDFVQGDIRDGDLMRRTLREHGVSAVIHLAGLKAVGESVQKPLEYWDNNVVGTLHMLKAMNDCGVRSLVFSSSATVYGEPQRLPITESHPLSATSPYGQTKLAIEHMLRDLSASDERWHLCLLRYFNPVGAHDSGLIGEDPNGIPNNLMPYVLKVAAGQFKELSVWGGDYPTPDGTGVRDYIHVVDLAAGHVAALQHLDGMRCEAINLGTGRGISVLELVRAFEQVNGVKVPSVMRDRRASDVTSCFANASLAERRLGWRTQRTLEDMCRDAWRWKNSTAARPSRC